MEFTLLGAAAIGVGSLYAVLWFEAGRTNAADCTRDVWDALLTAAVVGVLVGRIVAMLRDGTNPISHPGDLLIVRGGVDTASAALGALATYGWMVRRDLFVLADAGAAAALAGLAGWQAGCTVRDACLGARSDLPWAVTQDGSAIGRHPVEIYAALLLVAATVAVIWWKARHRPRAAGIIAGSAVAAAAGARLVTEPLRVGIGQDLIGWYAVGTLLGVAAALGRWKASRGAATGSG